MRLWDINSARVASEILEGVKDIQKGPSVEAAGEYFEKLFSQANNACPSLPCLGAVTYCDELLADVTPSEVKKAARKLK